MTFEKLDEMTKDKSTLLLGENENGESVTIKWNKERTVYETFTHQDNGWIRINRYHKDGTIEEEYER